MSLVQSFDNHPIPTVPTINKNNIWITDSSKDTLLDVEDYISQKDNDDPSDRFIKFTDYFLKNKNIDVLEVASGSGNLTRYLLPYLNTKNLNTYWSSDISPPFLEYQDKYLKQKNIPTDNCKFIQIDANNICFTESTFDLVVGSSCLHHFLHYEKTLEQCYKVLKPGGIAIFAEPIRTGNQPIWLMISLMADFDKQSKTPIFNENIYRRMHGFGDGCNYLLNLKKNNNYEQLSKYEDKYQFSMGGMKTLSNKIGFSKFVPLIDVDEKCTDYFPTMKSFITQIELYMGLIIKNWKFNPKFMNIVERVYNLMVKPFTGDDHCCLYTSFCFVK